MIIISSHFVKSGQHIYSPLVDNLEIIFSNKEFLVIQHTLNNDFESRYYFSNNMKNIKKIKGIVNNISSLRYFTEIVSTLFLLKKLNINEKVFFIGIDPLNALIGYFYGLFKKDLITIYYIPDYSPQRFNNKGLNNIYHWIEKFVSKKSDYLWCVSTEIYKLKNIRHNVYLLKNYPPKSILYEGVAHYDLNNLCMMGYLDDYYLIDEILLAVAKLKEQYNEIMLYILGGGPKLESYQKLVSRYNLENSVMFLGHISKKTDVLKKIASFGVGLAIYSNKTNYNKYRDSVKARDYIAVGVPSITTNNHPVADEVEKNRLGVVIDSFGKNISDSIVNAYIKIRENYGQFRNNCFNYYKVDYENEDIINSIIQ